MAGKEIWALFLIFLEMNDAKSSFLYYYRKDVDGKNAYCRDGYMLRHDNGGNGAMDFIHSIRVNRTRQGHRYWQDLSMEWRVVVCKLRDADRLHKH